MTETDTFRFMLEISIKIGSVQIATLEGILLMKYTRQTRLKSSLINYADKTLSFSTIGNSQGFGIFSHSQRKICMISGNNHSVLLYLKRLVSFSLQETHFKVSCWIKVTILLTLSWLLNKTGNYIFCLKMIAAI